MTVYKVTVSTTSEKEVEAIKRISTCLIQEYNFKSKKDAIEALEDFCQSIQLSRLKNRSKEIFLKAQ